MRNLAGRLDRLEEGKAGRKASAFYVLWVNPGDDREAALRSSGKIASDAPAYCAEWKVPDEYVRQGRNLGPRARSRLTNHHRISEDEKNILWHALGDDLKVHTIAARAEKSDERTRQNINEMTDRELIDAIITAGV